MGKVTEAGTCLLGLVDVETSWCFTDREQGVWLELKAEDGIEYQAECSERLSDLAKVTQQANSRERI